LIFREKLSELHASVVETLTQGWELAAMPGEPRCHAAERRINSPLMQITPPIIQIALDYPTIEEAVAKAKTIQ